MPLTIDPNKPRPTLKASPITLIKVSYHDLERFIREATGRDISIPAEMEWGNGEDHEVTIDGSDSDAEDYEDFLAGRPTSYALYAIMDGLARDGLLAKGKYLIEIFW